MTVTPAFAQTDREASMLEGNRLFRSGLYRAALSSYRQAEAAGLDTPLLHYNSGLALYKLGEYSAAEEELARAAQEPELAALAYYNRGLSSRARHGEDADRWFRLALERADDAALRRLAQSALRAARPPGAQPGLVEQGAGAAAQRAGGLKLAAHAKLGQDDNVYRTPADPYVDLAAAGAPSVTPSPSSAAFLRLESLAEYSIENHNGDTRFDLGYRMDGDFYDGKFANATRVTHRLLFGADMLLGEADARSRRAMAGFFLTRHREGNFDPDTGVDRELDGADLADRFSFAGGGVQGGFEQRVARWTWGLDLRLERREHERTQWVANFDQALYLGSAWARYALNDATTLDFGIRRHRRVYDDRLARDSTGALIEGNPALAYDYEGAEVGMQRRLTRTLEFDVRYSRLERRDEFLGYEDYTQDALALRADYRPHPRFGFSAGATAESYNYPSAFAYNVPLGGPRELERLGLELLAEFRLTEHLALWAEVDLDDIAASDARAAYDRGRPMIGASWRR
jgi:hypothetical protein